MRIVVIGATGTIGREVVKALSGDHDVIRVALKDADYVADITSRASLEELFRKVRPFDAVATPAGDARFGPMDGLSDDDFQVGLASKLMGQVNVVRIGRAFINDHGSFTLTSGSLSQEPMVGSTSVSMINAGIEGFVRAAALEMTRGVRINAVSPIWVTETVAVLKLDVPRTVPAAKVATVYRESIEGRRNGEVLDVRKFV
jgi:NAD(P)-dependent dehydrogenase (short-subunit alcohol dehydrogenase family)